MKSKLQLMLLTFAVACCGCSGTAVNKVRDNSVSYAPPSTNNSFSNSNSVEVAIATPLPRKQHLNCGKYIDGLEKSVSIPDELCFDRKRSVDETEYLNPQDFRTTNLYKSYDVSYEEVPPEVRQVIEIIRGTRYRGTKFFVTVLADRDSFAARGKLTKLYEYGAYERPGVLFEDNFEFKVKDAKMKFYRADLREE